MPYNSMPPVAAVECPPDLVIIPQMRFVARRRQPLWMAREPILFSVSGERGVHLTRLTEATPVLDHGEAPIFDGCGTKNTIVAHFPGHVPLKKQKYSSTRKNQKKVSNSRNKVLRQVAEVMEDFIETLQFQEVTDPYGLRFGPNGITLDDLYLLELHQVSRASFQPVLAVKKERAYWLRGVPVTGTNQSPGDWGLDSGMLAG